MAFEGFHVGLNLLFQTSLLSHKLCYPIHNDELFVACRLDYSLKMDPVSLMAQYFQSWQIS
jgi:hypothetical protein